MENNKVDQVSIVALIAAALLAAFVFFGGPAQTVQADGIEEPQGNEPVLVKALLLADTHSPAELLTLAETVRQAGGVPLATFPNQGLLLLLDPQQAQAIRVLPGVRLLSQSATALELAGEDSGAQDAVRVWNRMLAEQSAALRAPQAKPILPPLPDNDSVQAPRANQPRVPTLLSTSYNWQTSEYMLYNVNVDVFLVESNGAIDANSENWTTAMRDQVQAEISKGLTWWITAASVGGQPSAHLMFNINYHTPWNDPAVVQTGYEPIIHNYDDDPVADYVQGGESLWINQVMNHMGYNDTSHYTNVYNYNHDRRTLLGTDWSITIFVVNSLNDVDGMFLDGRFGYAYVYGPFMVMTYDNDGWGIDNMEMVTAHENAHLFGGLDEYADSGCTDTQTSGYLNVANTNCENGSPATEDSIMRGPTSQYAAYSAYGVSTPVRGMVGWRDLNGNGIYDPIDTTPTLTLNLNSSEYATTSSVVLTGTATDPAYPSVTRPAASISNLQWVDYRVNSGSWKPCAAIDGVFNETFEDYQCQINGLEDGSDTIEVRATNRVNNSSAEPYPATTLTVDTTPPISPVEANPNCTAASNLWQNTCSTPDFTWAAGSDAASGVARYYFYWGSEPNGTSTTYTTSTGYHPPAVDPGSYYLRLKTQDRAGNSSSWSTLFILRYENIAPTGSMLINSSATYTGTVSVSLALAANDSGGSGLAQMRFTNDGSTWSEWEAYAAGKAWTLTASEGARTVTMQLMDNAGNRSANATASIILDTTPPTGTIIVIPAVPYTSSTTVNLAILASDGASGIAQMRFSNDNSTWSGWETYATGKAWSLISGDGSKTVYAQFKDMVGNASDSADTSIILDTAPPSGTVNINGSAAYSSEVVVSLGLSASDSRSGVAQMRFSNDSSSWSEWEAYTTSKTWTLSAGDGSKTVRAQFIDQAGNVSSGDSDSILLDSTPPEGSVSVNSGAAYTNAAVVSLAMLASDAGSGVADMRFSNDGSSWSDWETYTNQKAWSLSGNDGTKTIFVELRDAAGATSQMTTRITLDTLAPQVTVTIPQFAQNQRIALRWSSVENGSGQVQYDVQFRLSTDSPWNDWLISTAQTSASFGPQVPGSGETITTVFFRLRARDALGNTSVYIETDTPQPYFYLYLPAALR